VSLLLFATGALEQGNKCADVAVVGGAKHSSSDNNSLLADRKYYQKVDSQAKNFSNSPFGATFWAQGVAEDRFGRYFLAPSVAGGSSSGEYPDVAGRGGKLKM
jgi:hypothetical protein